MSAHDDEGDFEDNPETVIDPGVPTGARDRPAHFDPTARIEDNRKTLPGDNDRPFVPPVLPLQVRHDVPPRPARKPGFDPKMRIDENIRTRVVEPNPRVVEPKPQVVEPKPQVVEPKPRELGQPPEAGSGAMRAISMKTPGVVVAPKQRQMPQVKLRALAELHKAPARDLGNLAPPRDPNATRSRDRRDHVIWASVAVIVASIVTLVIWFLARR